jgi:hypothetical protein
MLLTAVAAGAQTATRIEGAVTSIDPAGKTITFTDGRVMQFDSDAKIFVNGREVTPADVTPGAVVLVTSAVPVVPPTERITGTVAAIDPFAKTVTFTDGRVVQFNSSSRIFVNGREVVADEGRPGVVVTMATSTAGTVVPGSMQAAATPGMLRVRSHERSNIAWPAYRAAVIEGDDILVVRYPQAP